MDTYGIPHHKKVILYIPSFRDNHRVDCYGLDAHTLLSALENKFGHDWVLMVRLHPRLKEIFENDLFKFSKHIIDATYYPDIQEILVAGDAAITDYSSCIFDFMLSYKPAFIFATDRQNYGSDRGFYYPLSETPFPIAESNAELIRNIKNFDIKKYQTAVKKFLKGKGCMEDGCASSRVVDLIENIMKEKV